MALKSRLKSVDGPAPTTLFPASDCGCLVDFYREEFRKHHQCLELQREYYSEIAISQAEDALTRILQQIEQLCQRDDAPLLVSQLLRQFDSVTRLSAWTEPQQLN
jgi:hypothetical protein